MEVTGMIFLAAYEHYGSNFESNVSEQFIKEFFVIINVIYLLDLHLFMI